MPPASTAWWPNATKDKAAAANSNFSALNADEIASFDPVTYAPTSKIAKARTRSWNAVPTCAAAAIASPRTAESAALAARSAYRCGWPSPSGRRSLPRRHRLRPIRQRRTRAKKRKHGRTGSRTVGRHDDDRRPGLRPRARCVKFQPAIPCRHPRRLLREQQETSARRARAMRTLLLDFHPTRRQRSIPGR